MARKFCAWEFVSGSMNTSSGNRLKTTELESYMSLVYSDNEDVNKNSQCSYEHKTGVVKKVIFP